jgi:hypothetical protein
LKQVAMAIELNKSFLVSKNNKIHDIQTNILSTSRYLKWNTSKNLNKSNNLSLSLENLNDRDFYDLNAKKLSDASNHNHVNTKHLVSNISTIQEKYRFNKVHFNVGGVRFETHLSTLKRLPNTRLSTLTTSDPNYDSVRNEYFYDRNPNLFSYILNFYRTGLINYLIYIYKLIACSLLYCP